MQPTSPDILLSIGQLRWAKPGWWITCSRKEPILVTRPNLVELSRRPSLLNAVSHTSIGLNKLLWFLICNFFSITIDHLRVKLMLERAEITYRSYWILLIFKRKRRDIIILRSKLYYNCITLYLCTVHKKTKRKKTTDQTPKKHIVQRIFLEIISGGNVWRSEQKKRKIF